MKKRTLVGNVAKHGGGAYRVESVVDDCGRREVAVREMYPGPDGQLRAGPEGLEIKPQYLADLFKLALRAAKGGDL